MRLPSLRCEALGLAEIIAEVRARAWGNARAWGDAMAWGDAKVPDSSGGYNLIAGLRGEWCNLLHCATRWGEGLHLFYAPACL